MSESSNSRTVDLVRTVSFSAAHRYFDAALSEAENRQIYGSLYREKGFGHNFLLEAHFSGPIDPMTGMVLNLRLVDEWLHDVSMILDHQHLNSLPAFKGQAPTPERIARFTYQELKARLEKWSAQQVSTDPVQAVMASERPGPRLRKVRLYEGETSWVDYGAN